MPNRSFFLFFEELLFAPKIYHYPIIILFLPIALLYAVVMLIRRIVTRQHTYDIPIISIGNLIMGGSGKTPFIIAIASKYQDVAVVSRGYGRESRGLVEVSYQGKVLVDVTQSGDEAMLIAQSLPNATVIVSKNRDLAIEHAQRLGAKIVFLDDGFNRVEIKKFEILLEPNKIKNYLPLPAGAFREVYFSTYFANMVLKESIDFHRVVSFENLTQRMLLVTAISNPSRLDVYLPEGVVDKLIFADHSYFDINLIQNKMREAEATSLLVTQKDWVKLQEATLPLSLMKLSLKINPLVIERIDNYIHTSR
jgi:tetraacyldisaccharide 4'-kinase